MAGNYEKRDDDIHYGHPHVYEVVVFAQGMIRPIHNQFFDTYNEARYLIKSTMDGLAFPRHIIEKIILINIEEDTDFKESQITYTKEKGVWKETYQQIVDADL